MSGAGNHGVLGDAAGVPDRDGWLVRVDTGGTFTDGWALDSAGRERRCKVLSSGVLRGTIEECPDGRSLRLSGDFGARDGLLKGFRLSGGAEVVAWLQEERLLQCDREHGLAVGDVVELSTGEEAPVLAARMLTGTAVAEDFPRLQFRLATTRGTNALLERTGADGALLVTEGFEDLLRVRDQRRSELFALQQEKPEPVFRKVYGVNGRVGANGEILEELDEEGLAKVVAELVEEGVSVVAVALLNAYANPDHEDRVREVLVEAGVRYLSLSHELSDSVRLLPRVETAVANAYLEPVMERFISRVTGALADVELELMTSAGFLKPAGTYRPIDSLLSGPAAGVRGALAAASAAGRHRVLAFDMGGTSTDVARVDGAPGFRYEQVIGNVRVLAPAVRIETVAAGGGSICQWRNGGLTVGPESAGAEPGPACYGRGGPLTITDVNLLLGCMDPDKAGIPLDRGSAEKAFDRLKKEMEGEGHEALEDGVLLEGLREIAVERMADAIRRVSVREGYDPSEYMLVAFGGAGPQHACAVAEKLGVREILVPGDAGLLSAWGLHRSAKESMATRQMLCGLEECSTSFGAGFEELEAEARESLGEEGEVSRWFVELRLVGQDAGIEIEYDCRPGLRRVCLAFGERYEKLYGYPIPESRAIELVALRVLASESLSGLESEEFRVSSTACAEREVLQDDYRTCVIDSGWSRAEGSRGSLLLVKDAAGTAVSVPLAPEVGAELFRARFESVVEEMGALLQRMALSTNIKERLDFSCALLDADGRLVVNAPHIPVHLGALGVCVRMVSEGREWAEGDMVVVNHPGFGGSHLPDVTVISPVFSESQVIGYVANRAHHAEIGGLAPGSMPASAGCLEEEGVVIPPMLLFEGGQSRFEDLESHFYAAAHPSRCVEDNMADLAAQVAANRHGVEAVGRLVGKSGAEEVRKQMATLYQRAAEIMRERLGRVGEAVCAAADALDDGTAVQVEVRCDGRKLVVDFAGSGPEHPGNLNAVPAIVRSAVLYVLRAWVDEPIPLNEGLLEDVEIVVPRGVLNPEFSEALAECPAVVGGNVETSQRVVDVLLLALGLQANGQGTMNNILFGTEEFGYYETIGGGSGAGAGWDGMSGTHVHMSNTAITDAEILERRYPVRVRRFGLREGSGGAGRWKGGEGLVREFEFLEKMTVSLLTQRRALSPRGGEGGGDGGTGRQTLVKAGGGEVVLPGTTSFEVQPGDRIVMETPGGGGWGKA